MHPPSGDGGYRSHRCQAVEGGGRQSVQLGTGKIVRIRTILHFG